MAIQEINFIDLPLDQQLDLYSHNQVVWKQQASESAFKEMRLKVAEQNPDSEFLNFFLVREKDYEVRLAIIKNPNFVIHESIKRRFSGSSNYEDRMLLANYEKLPSEYFFNMLKKEFERYKTINVVNEILNNPSFVIDSSVHKYLREKGYTLKVIY